MGLKGKTLLITGGTGSFGRAMTRRLIKEDACAKVIIFSRDEWKQWEMQQADPLFTSEKMRYFLGDIRDEKRLALALQHVDIVIHAAALKQVPAAEYNPTEFIKTNILGAMNLIDVAIERRVEKVLALSTDKCVNPINLYGATKLCAEKLFIAANSNVGPEKKPSFSVVRYGNVIGSRGSVIPRWQQMVAEGAKEIPLTDQNMTRFWISLEDAVSFVLKSLQTMKGEEIFIPKIPTIKLADIASAIAPNLPQTITGIREGEKLHETLISPDEARDTFDCDDHYMILPPVHKKNRQTRHLEKSNGSKAVADNFSYTSDNNPQKLSAKDINAKISEIK